MNAIQLSVVLFLLLPTSILLFQSSDTIQLINNVLSTLTLDQIDNIGSTYLFNWLRINHNHLTDASDFMIIRSSRFYEFLIQFNRLMPVVTFALFVIFTQSQSIFGTDLTVYLTATDDSHLLAGLIPDLLTSVVILAYSLNPILIGFSLVFIYHLKKRSIEKKNTDLKKESRADHLDQLFSSPGVSTTQVVILQRD